MNCYHQMRIWVLTSEVLLFLLLFIISGHKSFSFFPSNNLIHHRYSKFSNVILRGEKTKKNCETYSSPLTSAQKEFFNSLDSMVYGKKFLKRLEELQKYKNEYGTCHVPKRYINNPTLGNWVNKQRQMYRKFLEGEQSSMTRERLEILNKIGFAWSGTIKIDDSEGSPKQIIKSADDAWMEMFEELKKNIGKHRESTSSISSRTKLGVWCAIQRRHYEKLRLGEMSRITKNRIDLLNSLGFDWSPWKTKWNMRVEELVEYKEKYGNCLVPVQWRENPQLGRWVSTQRKYYKLHQQGKPSYISNDRINELTNIGFVWSRWEYKWNEDGINVENSNDKIMEVP